MENYWKELDFTAIFQNDVLREVVGSAIMASALLNMNPHAFTAEIFHYIVQTIVSNYRERNFAPVDFDFSTIPAAGSGAAGAAGSAGAAGIAGGRKLIPLDRIHFSTVREGDYEFDHPSPINLHVPFLQRISADHHATLLCGDGKGHYFHFDSNGSDTTEATEGYVNRINDLVVAERGTLQRILTGRLQTSPLCATWVVCLATMVACCNFDFTALQERIQNAIPTRDVLEFAFEQTFTLICRGRRRILLRAGSDPDAGQRA